jgi:hypothetical protein
MDDAYTQPHVYIDCGQPPDSASMYGYLRNMHIDTHIKYVCRGCLQPTDSAAVYACVFTQNAHVHT